MYLYGASGHAKVIIEILENSRIPIHGLFDDNPEITNLCGYSCTLFNEKTLTVKELIISIGDNKTRKYIVDKVGEVKFGKAIAVNSLISERAIIGDGTVIMPGAVINSSSKIGKHVIINTNASIDHDCMLDDYVHISPGVSIAGNVTIKEGTQIGIGASIIPGIKIGKWCIIGAGSIIIRNVPDNVVVVGNPGKIIKSNSFK